MEKSFLKFGVLILIVLLLTACSSKPEDVSQDLWDKGIQYTLYIDKLTKGEEDLPDGLGDELKELITNDTEKEIVVDIYTLAASSILYTVNSKFGNDSEEAKKNYDEKYKQLEEVFGVSNLKSSKLDEELVASMLTENVSNQQAEKEEIKTTFMKENGITLTGKEVQFNMANNLEEPFYLEGTVELCDYYNYAYKNGEKTMFCGQLTPNDGGYSDSWYLYFDREVFGFMYDELLTNGSRELMISAVIFGGKYYDDNQGKMASVLKTGIK